MSLDQRVLFWNQSAQRILGYAPESVIGRQLNQTLEPIIVDGPNQAIQEGCPTVVSLREGKVPERVRVRIQCASGISKLVWITPMVIAGATSDATVLVHLFQDERASAGDDPDPDWFTDALESEDAVAVAEPPAGYELPTQGIGLTGRELEVLRLVALGWATPRIAEELNISPHTVLNHIRHFRRKLNAPTKLDAVVSAIRQGILPVE